MRLYSLGMIIFCSFSALVTLIVMLSSSIDLYNPEGELKHSEYKEHISYDYYKQQELKRYSDNKSGIDLSKLTENDWEKRWKLSKELSIKQIIHAQKSSLFNSSVVFISFFILLVIHIVLYRRSKPVTLTI